MRCKVDDLAYIVGPPGEMDYLGVRGLICEVVGPAFLANHDWSVRLAHKKPDFVLGTFAAMDSWLRPLPPAEQETPTQIIEMMKARHP
jgi:hypothetical protein